MRGQYVLEPDHEIGATSSGFEIAVGIVCCETVDKRVNQFLLDGSGDLWVLD